MSFVCCISTTLFSEFSVVCKTNDIWFGVCKCFQDHWKKILILVYIILASNRVTGEEVRRWRVRPGAINKSAFSRSSSSWSKVSAKTNWRKKTQTKTRCKTINGKKRCKTHTKTSSVKKSSKLTEKGTRTKISRSG